VQPAAEKSRETTNQKGARAKTQHEKKVVWNLPPPTQKTKKSKQQIFFEGHRLFLPVHLHCTDRLSLLYAVPPKAIRTHTIIHTPPFTMFSLCCLSRQTTFLCVFIFVCPSALHRQVLPPFTPQTCMWMLIPACRYPNRATRCTFHSRSHSLACSLTQTSTHTLCSYSSFSLRLLIFDPVHTHAAFRLIARCVVVSFCCSPQACSCSRNGTPLTWWGTCEPSVSLSLFVALCLFFLQSHTHILTHSVFAVF